MSGKFRKNGVTVDRAVVETMTLKFTGVVPFKVTERGVTEQLAAAGAPLQARFTLVLRPEVPLIERLYVAVLPAETVAVVAPPGCTPTLKSVPLPVTATVLCVPP